MRRDDLFSFFGWSREESWFLTFVRVHSELVVEDGGGESTGTEGTMSFD